MFQLNNFDAMKIGIASPEKIREWSYGEVTKPETINYRTQKPERDGLFCEKIFGPTKDWECHCGRYKRIKHKGVICEKCGVEVTKAKVRRERMGHIELAAPVSHIWYFRNRIGLILDMSPKALEQVLYFVSLVVLDPGETDLTYKQVLSDREIAEAEEKWGVGSFRYGMGAEAIKELLAAVDLKAELAAVKQEFETSQGQKKIRAVKRLEILDAFVKSNQDPTWMILDVLPVMPPELRPMVQLDGGRYAASDINDLYRRVINRNNRLKKLMDYGAPDIIIRNEKRMLQEAVDALIDNGRKGKPISGAGNRELKSLSSMLKGKQGRFRQNLLGKRVDYSGRSVIVVGPELKMYQCGLPKEMALELFKPFVMHKLVENNPTCNVKSAKRMVERGDRKVWDMLEEVIKDHPVLLNRAPTLHRLGIQAFEPVLVEGRAIKLHPLACTAFNADFDGDQMAVHVPLSIEAQTEARFLMLSTNNILKLSDGKPVVSPTQDMIMGSYYLTIVRPGAKGEGMMFKDPEEALMAYANGDVALSAIVRVRVTKDFDADGAVVYKQGGAAFTAAECEKLGYHRRSRIITTTVGRIIFNSAIPQNIAYNVGNDLDFTMFPGLDVSALTAEEIADVKAKDAVFQYKINKLVDKKILSKIVDQTFKAIGSTGTSVVLDDIKKQGYKYATIGAITTSVFDMHVPPTKYEILEKAEQEVITIEEQYEYGFMTEQDKHERIVAIWQEATEQVKKALLNGLDKFNPIKMMAESGARGNNDQIKQLAGMRGPMANPNGEIIETPVRASFREGLSVLEYFISSHGGRKGLADTALKTADSGYLTRRLVDVSQDVIVREDDCFAELGERPKGMKVRVIKEGDRVLETLAERITGRYTIDPVCDPATGEVLVPADTMISEAQAKEIEKRGIEEVLIRTVFTCRSRNGVCAKCYGKDMASFNRVRRGEAVGIIAAQSIGEPGTQLTMRTFHSGGVASTGDITRGLPRVEELFEARKPKGCAILTEYAGTVRINEHDNKREVIVHTTDGEDKIYPIPYGLKVLQTLENGMTVAPGDPLTEGSLYPHDILRTKGPAGVQDYLLQQVQFVYRDQGVDINDKHIEVIVRQMLRKVKVETSGDTQLLPGKLIDLFSFEEANQNVLEEGGVPASGKRILQSITKAALTSESFLSAASFQETSKVLTEAAIENKVDNLIGLKENVIIGKKIPAGTGFRKYANVTFEAVEDFVKKANEENE